MKEYDLLIKNGTVLTMDNQLQTVPSGSVGIEGDSISYVGVDLTGGYMAKTTIDAKGGLIMPGLINGHTHAAMTLFRGLADDMPLMDWLNNYIFPVESRMDKDFISTGTLLACAEMIRSGTTTFCDMYLFEDEVAQAAKKAGMRCLAGEVLYDFDSPNYGSIENGFKYTESLIEKWRNDPLISIAVEPHALFTCSPELLTKANDMALKHGVPLIVHLAETKHEVKEIQERYGKGPVEHLKALGILGPHLIADHCVHLDGKDMSSFSRHDVKVIHNPESNMKLASGIAPVPDFLSNGIIVGLGTDGCASNNNLDLFAEMDMAAKLHKLHRMDTTVMDALTVLKMATIEGAKALGMGDMIGSLEIGKKADVILLDLNKPHLTPLYNHYSHLVYAARGNDVSHVIINGRLVMEDRKLLMMDVEDIMERAQRKSRDILEWIPNSI